MASGKGWQRARRTASALVALFLFVLALQVLKEGARGFGPFVQDVLRVDSAANALGFGWVLAYVLLSGSPVAALALTFHAGDVLTDVQTFLAITGSRLGAAFVVLGLGFVYRLRGHGRYTSMQMGVLSLLVTYSVYVPAAVLGYWLLTTGALDDVHPALPVALVDVIDLVFDPIVDAAVARLPVVALFALGLALLVGAFQLFDRALPEVPPGPTPHHIERVIFRPWVMFGAGLLLTLLTMSVSVSLGLLVPLGAKGIARRENIVPYILGANISTFIDTLVASLLLGVPRGVTIVLVEILAVAATSILILMLGYRYYERAILGGLDRVLASERTLVTFLVIILAAPVILMLV